MLDEMNLTEEARDRAARRRRRGTSVTWPEMSATQMLEKDKSDRPVVWDPTISIQEFRKWWRSTSPIASRLRLPGDYERGLYDEFNTKKGDVKGSALEHTYPSDPDLVQKIIESRLQFQDPGQTHLQKQWLKRHRVDPSMYAHSPFGNVERERHLGSFTSFGDPKKDAVLRAMKQTRAWPGRGRRFATALVDFEGGSPGDLSFKAGDRLVLLKIQAKIFDQVSWWKGHVAGKPEVVGIFPSHFVTVALSSDTSPEPSEPEPEPELPLQSPRGASYHLNDSESSDDESHSVGAASALDLAQQTAEIAAARAAWRAGDHAGADADFFQPAEIFQ